MGLKILHVANIAQNAFINATILNDRGHDCDLLAFDVYHVASSPEWYGLIGTSVDVGLLGDDPFFPNFYALGRSMPTVGDWVAHGPVSTAMRYLIHKRRRDPLSHLSLSTLNYLRFKATMQRTTMPQAAPLTDIDFDAALERYDLDSKLRRRIRTGRMAERYSDWIQRRLDVALREDGASPQRLPVSAALLDHYAAADPSLGGVLKALRTRGLSEIFGVEYPEPDLDTRALERLGFDRQDVLPFMGTGPLWRELASHYDVCIFYGDSAIFALMAGLKHYWTLEHGTIRTIPFEPTPYGRLVAEAYHNATRVFLTNTDYATAQERLEFRFGQGVYAFHPFDEAPAFAMHAAHVRRREAGRICFFCPARQDWTANDPKMCKGNDTYFRGAKLLLDSGRRNFVLRCIDWGVDRATSRALILELGLTEHVVWEPIMSKSDLWASMLDAHAVLDQFLLSSFSGVTFESLALGCRLITKDDGIANGIFFADPPPLLAASSMQDIAVRMAEVMDDPEDEAGIGERGMAWIRAHHSADRLVELQLSAFAARPGAKQLAEDEMKKRWGSKLVRRDDRAWLPPRRGPARSESRGLTWRALQAAIDPGSEPDSQPTDCSDDLPDVASPPVTDAVASVDVAPERPAAQSIPDVSSQIPIILNALNALENKAIASATNIAGLVEVDIPAIRNALNGLENSVLVLRLLAEQAAASDWRRDQVDVLHRRAVAARTHPPADALLIETVRPHALAETLRDLEQRAPGNFEAWLRLLEESKGHYRKRSAADLSVAWHREAHLFGEFLAVHAAGRVLDIGVGPLPVPSYLDAIPPDRLAGLDPIEPFEPHPFAFANSVAEAIPWPDASFETVVAATSLDHTYLLDVALEEVTRVLAPGGVFLLWTTLLPESPVYNPYGDAFQPIDDYHLFHPGENWFPALMARWFRMRERIDVAPNNVFMAFERN